MTVKKTQFEVIVVDNSSKDEGLSSVLNRFPETRLIDNSTNLGFACANNQGADIARGKFLLFIIAIVTPFVPLNACSSVITGISAPGGRGSVPTA